MKFFILISLLSLTYIVYSFDWRVDEIPNGNEFDCSFCHFSAGEGGPLNDFGKQVKNFGITNFRVDWSKLYDKDADGDGFTNGEEMGDPEGNWRIGDPDPIVNYPLTKPWDPDDFPTTVDSDNYIQNIKSYPNPFSEYITVELFLEQNGNLFIEVFDILGNRVNIINDRFESAGKLTFTWDGTDFNGNKLSPGHYTIRISHNNTHTNLKIALE